MFVYLYVRIRTNLERNGISMVKFSIIVPVYNVEKYLNRCLESIINQTYSNIEVIIVNDGSKDNSLKICERFKNKDERIILIDQVNCGVSIARNNGLKEASGDYVIFVDSDDWIEKDACEKISKILEKQKFDLIIMQYKKYKGNKFQNIIYNSKITDMDIEHIICDEKLGINGYLWNKVFKKECIESFFRPKTYYMEDLLFILENKKRLNNVFIDFDNFYYIYNCNEFSVMNEKEYSYKRITALETAKIIIELCEDKYKCFQEMNLLKNYYRIKYYDSKFVDTVVERNKKKYVKDIFCSKYLVIKEKIEIFILVYCSSIYNYYKKMKGDKNEKS